MIRFVKFLEAIRTQGVIELKSNMNLKPHDHMWDEILSAKTFVFKEGITPSLTRLDDTDVSYREQSAQMKSKLSLPFDTCWFEVLENDGVILNMVVPLSNNEVGEMALLGLLVHEMKPGIFEYYMLMRKESNSDLGVFWFNEGLDGTDIIKLNARTETIDQSGKPHYEDSDYSLSMIALRACSGLLAKMDNGVSAVVNVNERVKIKKSHGNTELHKIKKVIYVVPKAEKGAPIPGFAATAVDWTHRWTVRGHWRTIVGVGKNREGVYCVENFTWVSDHVRGPEHAPLISDKVRIVKGEQS